MRGFLDIIQQSGDKNETIRNKTNPLSNRKHIGSFEYSSLFPKTIFYPLSTDADLFHLHTRLGFKRRKGADSRDRDQGYGLSANPHNY